MFMIIGQSRGCLYKETGGFFDVDVLLYMHPLLSVLYAARSICDSRIRTVSEKDALACVMQWKQRRKPALDEGEVGLTIRKLAALNWLNVKASSDLPLPAEETVDA